MSPIDEVAVEAQRRAYPHVGEIKDWPAQQSTRLIWERVHDLEARLTAAQATITTLVAGHNTNEIAIAEATRKATTALALAQVPGRAPTSDTGNGGNGDLPGGGDGGAGNVGCSAAGATGHDTGGLLNAIRAGQIVCGTGNEFSALKNPVATLAEREANLEELLRRMIWHLQLAGFSAGRQRNPSGVISKDKLTVVVDDVLRAYDVFGGVDPSDPVPTQMSEVAPPEKVDDLGIPD